MRNISRESGKRAEGFQGLQVQELSSRSVAWRLLSTNYQLPTTNYQLPTTINSIP
ncbi:hypothetical protein IQ272_24900 [Chroococcidiopsidales cyanobacterium LEGE 13417]|nr:hypothetical protein [Chroococcidiopsidales cyanobacterium LEGE 13417]